MTDENQVAEERQEGTLGSEQRESVSPNERPKLRETLKAAWNEHQAPKEKSPARQAAATERTRDERGKFAVGEAEAVRQPTATPETKDSPPKAKEERSDAQPQAAVSDRPTSWGADKANLWSSLSKEAQEFISKREADISKGFADYGPKVKRLQEVDEVMAPIRPMLQRLGQSDAQGIRTMLSWQQALSNPATQHEAFKGLARQLGFNLSTLAPAPQGAQQQTESDPIAQHLQGMLAPVVSRFNEFGQKLTAFEMQQQQERAQRANAEISVFSKDKPYFDRVRQSMGQLMAAGISQTLEDAYNKAVWADPEIRAEIQQTENAKREADLKAAQEAEHQKQAAADEEKRKKDAEAAARARRANVSPPTSTPNGGGAPSPKRAQSVRQSIAEAIKESRASI